MRARDGGADVLDFCISQGKRCAELLKDLRSRGLERVEMFVRAVSAAERAVFGQLARWHKKTYT